MSGVIVKRCGIESVTIESGDSHHPASSIKATGFVESPHHGVNLVCGEDTLWGERVELGWYTTDNVRKWCKALLELCDQVDGM